MYSTDCVGRFSFPEVSLFQCDFDKHRSPEQGQHALLDAPGLWSRCSEFLHGVYSAVSVSSVPLPVQSFLTRIKKVADELACRLRTTNGATPVPPEIALPLAKKFFYSEKGIKVSSFGRSNVPDR